MKSKKVFSNNRLSIKLLTLFFITPFFSVNFFAQESSKLKLKSGEFEKLELQLNNEILKLKKNNEIGDLEIYKNQNNASSSLIFIKQNMISGLLRRKEGGFNKISGTLQSPKLEPIEINQSVSCHSILSENQKKFLNSSQFLFENKIDYPQSRQYDTFDFELELALFVPSSIVINNIALSTEEIEQAAISRFEMVNLIFNDQVGINIKIDTIIQIPETYISGFREFLTLDNYLNDNPFTEYSFKHFLLNPLDRTGFLGQSPLHACEKASWSSITEDDVFDAIVWAHEFGHSFGALHTNSCEWPGGPIDSCRVDDLGCFIDPGVVDRKGTIMSGCNFPEMKFHPFAIELMRGYLKWAYCYNFEENETTFSGNIQYTLYEFDRIKEDPVVAYFKPLDQNRLYLDNLYEDSYELVFKEGSIVGNNLSTYGGVLDFEDVLIFPSLSNSVATMALPSFPQNLRLDIIPTVPLKLNFDEQNENELNQANIHLQDLKDRLILYRGFNYEFRNAHEGIYSFSASAPNVCFDSIPSIIINKENEDIPAIHVRPCPNMVQLSVIVEDRNFDAFPDIPIAIKGPIEQKKKTDATGQAFFYNIPAGQYVISVEDETRNYGTITGLGAYESDTVNITAEVSNLQRFYWANESIAPPFAPYLIVPANQDELQLNEEILFRWTPTNTGIEYEVEVARDTLFQEVIFQDQIEKKKAWSYFTPNNTGKYYWRVKAINEENVESKWSELGVFSIQEKTISIDNDGDGFTEETDCDDSNPNINPSAQEVTNSGVDEDCDGISLIIDADEDGWNSSIDCDDTNASINGGAVEIPNNNIDEDCDGMDLVTLRDQDGDGFLEDIDCDDNNENINPNVEEIGNSGVDENCDGVSLIIDLDEDGWNSSIDCDDTDASINGAAVEIPNNGIDEDCDGEDLINTSVHELGNKVINIYPNPFNDHFVVDIEGDYNNLRLKIITINGQIIYNSELTKWNLINLSNQSAGTYLIEIMDFRLNKKIIDKLIKIK